MPPLFLNRFLRAVSLLHPRSLAERARFHAQLVQRNERLMQQVDALTSEMRSLGAQLDTVSLREQQLRAILHADATGDDRVLGFQAMLDGIELEQHIRKATCKAELHLDPFPHCVVDGLFPKAYYNALVEAIPPVELFRDRVRNKQQLFVPFSFAPKYSRVVWAHMADVTATTMLAPWSWTSSSSRSPTGCAAASRLLATIRSRPSR